jgi:large subunit ribosomal protein L27
LGVKVFGGQQVANGGIIVRQNGSRFHPGKNVKMGRNFTLYSVVAGKVRFYQRQGKSLVGVENL